MPIQYLTNSAPVIEKVKAFVNEWYAEGTTIEVKTSGSTGIPKTIVHSKKHMIASARATGDYLNLSKGMKALLCLSPDTIGGKMMIVRSLILELELFVVDISSSPLDGIEETFNFAAMVPLQAQNSMLKNSESLNCIDQLIIGGAPVSNGLVSTLQHADCRCYHTFGMTETISHIAMRSLNQPQKEAFELLPNIAITVNDNEQMVITAPELGVEKLTTNDIIERTSPHQFIWKGRSDFVINSGGIKLHPETIESSLSELITPPFFVSGLQDSLLGEKLVLHIEGTGSYQKSDFTLLLGKFQSPKEVYYHANFHYTSSGKIDRSATLNNLPSVTRVLL
jgi:O-succinylbenzoic acid--CoA ligase